MKLDRRQLIAGAAALGMMPRKAEAWFPHGASTAIPIGHGWNTLPLGCGGLIVGFDIAPDGTMVVRTDVGNAYIFSGTSAQITDPAQKWLPLKTYASLGSGYAGANGTYNGAYELVIAPTLTTNLYAIFADDGGPTFSWALYYSTNSGQLWTKSAVTMLITDGGSNGTWKTSTRKVCVDPANENIVYCGIANGNSGKAGVYRATDGTTFAAATTDGSTPFPASSKGSGTCGIAFDKNYGTTTAFGKTVSARVIVPVGGVGIFESLDGGQNFTEIAVTAFGRSDISVHQAYTDYDGVYYCLVSYAGSQGPGYLWRYAPAAARGTASGTGWVQLDAQSGWTHGAGWTGSSAGTLLVVDPRNGHQGFLSVSGPNGIGNGFTSTNSNAATGSTIAWGGGTGGEATTLYAPSYDCPWLNHVWAFPTTFTEGTACMIDASGGCWWPGNQGAMWKFVQSDLSTPTIPNYAVSNVTYSFGVSRGTEVTVAQDAIEAPGAPYPVIAAQDVGIYQTSFQPGFYPTNFYPSPHRVDCETLEYAASDSSFYVGKVNVEVAVAPNNGGMYSSYSPSYGATGSWVPYAVQPDLLWCASIVGGVSGGVLTVTSFNSVTGLGNLVLVGQVVYPAVATYPSYGTVLAYGTGGTTGTGGVGTYSIGGSSSVSPGTTLSLAPTTAGGQMVAVDHDHHMCCITNNSGPSVPGYTANATSPTNTWQFCSGLPARDWMNRGYNFGSTSRPFAVGYGVDLGTVWACETLSGTATLWRSTDSGANFSSIVTFSDSASVAGGPFVLSVPGFPNELWITFYFTGGSNINVWHITNANTASATATPVGTPTSNPFCHSLTLGAPPTSGAYPAIYGIFNNSNGLGGQTVQEVFQGTYNTGTGAVTWSLFAHPNGTNQDLPSVSQIAGFQSIRGSWNQYQRLLVASGQSGFAYYNP